MSLIGIVVVLVVIGVILYFLQQVPMDPAIRTLIRVVVILFCLLWLLQALGIFGGGGPYFGTTNHHRIL